MSGRSRRDKSTYDLDYHKLGNKGERVHKNMDLPKLKITELQICDDITESLNLYNLDDLDTCDEVSEGIEQVTDVGKSYRHVHVELKEALGEEEYQQKYANTVETLEKIRTFQKNGRAKLKTLKREEDERNVANLTDQQQQQDHKALASMFEKEKKSKAALLIEEQVFKDKLSDDIANFELVDPEDIKISCARFEHLLDECYALLSKAKIVFNDEFDGKCKASFDDSISKIREQIRIGKAKISDLISDEQKKLALEKAKNDEIAHDSYANEQLSIAKILSDEIELRSNTLLKKCNSASLGNLNDYQILECNKNFGEIDTEMREIFGKFSEFSKIVILCRDDKDDQETLLKTPRSQQNKALKARNTYAMELHSIITERDISEEKLKKSGDFSIELSKFKGYDSKLDIYGFRSDFEKLIQPNIPKRIWVETLRKNYLTGPALTLVEKCETIEDVWKKLTDAYGNVKLLLQNKISSLDKLDNLEKIKSDEKLGVALAKIINMMTELSTLASKYNLEYKLYVGGGMEKVLNLVGETRERKFVSKNMKTNSNLSSSNDDSEVCTEKLEWENLKAFLEEERSLREKMTLLKKSKDCLGVSSQSGGPQRPQNNPPNNPNNRPNNRPTQYGQLYGAANVGGPVEYTCHLCGKTDHVVSKDQFGKKMVDYFSCKDLFADLSPNQRRLELQKRKFCLQCLRPGIKYDEEHICYKKYCCPDPSHASFPKGLHVLVCEAHKANPANIATLEDFKKIIIKKRSQHFKDFTKNIGLTCVSDTAHSTTIERGFSNVIPDVHESAIFMLQTINIDGVTLRLFFDTGCGDIVVKKSAMDALQQLGRAKQEVAGSVSMSGVGDVKSVSDHGIYSVCLPLKSGYNAVLSGVCMDRVTTEFPKYALKEVEKDIKRKCRIDGGESLVKTIPKLSNEVGGDTDILIGSKYLRYHPRECWRSETGLSVFDSFFVSADGTTGVVVGPHAKFTEIEQSFRESQADGNSTAVSYSCYSPSVIEYRNAYYNSTSKTALDNTSDSGNHLCGTSQAGDLDPYSCSENILLARRPPKCVKIFDEVDTAGTEATFRCIDCRSCEKCKTSKKVDALSIQEEIEQGVIDRNVEVDVEKGMTTHLLPFLTDPDLRLDSDAQERLARKVYEGVVKKLSDKPVDKEAIIKAEAKLHELGYVDYLDNLPKEVQDFIMSNLKYIIPWRVVYNPNSVSTPCRPVFDASASPKGKVSLNSLLAKGANNLNNLVMILIRWQCYLHAFHTDIRKMYNTIWLDRAHWRYQLYFWEGELKIGIAPRLKVIKTAIYGVRSSGNIAECGIRKTAELTKAKYPKAYDVMTNDLYVDDGMSGRNTLQERSETADQFSCALAEGGFLLKGYTFSEMDPPEDLANEDKVSVNVGGLKWFSKKDVISINVPQLNLGKKSRGRKSLDTADKIPEKLTKRNCTSVTYEIFDPLGKVTPLIAGFKIDISELHMKQLDWDDALPENLRQIWISNIEMIQEIRNVQYKRAVVPVDAVDLKIETIDTADASQVMICIAIYARFKLKSGGYSCQLIFSRSKTVPKDMSQPRAELLAASLNASTGHIVKTALGDRHRKHFKWTDSQVAYFWINSVRSKLKQWVRNHVIHINRLAPKEIWGVVKSEDMIADLGTRKGATLPDVAPDSEWINGKPAMRRDESDFPVKTASDIILCGEIKQEALKECISVESINTTMICQSVACIAHGPFVPKSVGDRYKFSQYVLDPNKFRFRKSVRVLGLSFLFISKLRNRTRKAKFAAIECNTDDLPSNDVIPLQENKYLVTTGNDKDGIFKCKSGLVVEIPLSMIKAAMQYYFRSATKEVKHFLPESKYKNISEEKSGILYHTGRILPTQEIGYDPTLCDVCFDLTKSTFCVPIVDGLSPLAYSIADEIHWYHPDVRHSGLESTLRETNRVAYIIGGRDLLKTMKEACARCRYLHKQEVKVAMGPQHESHLCIAPAFYNTQVDLCGPFESYSNANKRAKLKIWFVIFCCSTTGAVDSKVMEDYSTDSFILAFIRFACRYGYPFNMFPDAGSQLIKGCKDMVLSFSNIKYKLEVEYGVQFNTCPVGSHYVHGKVERKIREVRKSVEKEIQNQRLSIIRWETLGQQIANSINNMPIGIGNKSDCLENLDLITPNRLLLGRNNNRCPTAPLVLSNDVKKIVQSNEEIFKVWFKSWLISYVPTLVPKPKWFETNTNISIGDIVLITKSEKEFENLYQYGIVIALHKSKDNLVRSVDVQYQNHTENVKRVTKRGVREIVVIHPVEELGVSKELYQLASNSTCNTCTC